MFITDKSKVPKEPHWAILTFSTIHVPGDERSRTNPGHGYPASDEPTISYEAFMDEREWALEVTRRVHQEAGAGFHRCSWIAARIIPASVNTTVTVSVKDT